MVTGDETLMPLLAETGSHAFGVNADLLRSHLLRLRTIPMGVEARLSLIDRLYDHVGDVLASVWPALWDVALPLGRRERQPLRAVQGLLEALAHDYLAIAAAEEPPAGVGVDRLALSLWRVQYLLGCHLQIAYQVASPSAAGIWQSLHQAFVAARRLGVEGFLPEGERWQGRELYLQGLLLACSQPASFSATELAFLLSCLQQMPLPELSPQPPEGSKVLFWLDSGRDAPAYPLLRRLPPAGDGVLFFSTDALARQALRYLTALEGGLTASELALPPFAATLAGQAALRRLARIWGEPVRRRFPRRRRSYRVRLCPGFASAWQIFQQRDPVPDECGEWMIVNESPDGYAMMHMSGPVTGLLVGDVVSVLPESGDGRWLLCLVRWAQSENPEHLELGLQLLPPGAQAIRVGAQSSLNGRPVPALLLPKLPLADGAGLLLTAAGEIGRSPGGLRLLMSDDRQQDVQVDGREELTARVEIFSVVNAGTLSPQSDRR